MKLIIAISVLIFSCQGLAGFNNQIIVKTKGNISIPALGFSRTMVSVKPIMKGTPLNVLALNPALRTNAVLKALRQHPDVVYAQIDHPVTMRNNNNNNNNNNNDDDDNNNDDQPNDSDFANQWSMGLDDGNFGIDALSAWLTFGTGGKDVNDNSIVVAIVDGGVEVDHPDLEENIWINVNEVPDNGIDDDANGYVDDINGWDAYTDTGTMVGSRHGTHVAGIVGAKGNNEMQVTGVNWDTNLMAIKGSSGTTSIVLRAYSYVLAQKKLWLETNGEKGANVVATNSSFGIDFADCSSDNYAAWNDIYNEMGKYGILSAAATMNRTADVDAQGDVPTGCDSPYMISVTNTQKNGKRASAAYGKETIDLAAPGTQILSTITNGKVDYLSGTSMATPHVAGAIGFLSSVASLTLTDLYGSDPAAAALEMKDIILSSVSKTEELEDETVSGGILNLYEAAKKAAIYGLPSTDEDSTIEI